MMAKHSTELRRGNLFTTFHFPDLGLNGVLSSSADGLTGCPEFKVQAVTSSRRSNPVLGPVGVD
ncbi:MAG: hypothetical protein CM1200mP29_04260 [Verrucomicrobiota bacterium]|nr:MAG: hypothetical protein CM1200mP29_04260 [Verrucomicrobiota bacterium]